MTQGPSRARSRRSILLPASVVLASAVAVVAGGSTGGSRAEAAAGPFIVTPMIASPGDTISGSQNIVSPPSCASWTMVWDSPPVESVPDTSGPTFTGTLVVPAAATIGSHTVTARCASFTGLVTVGTATVRLVTSTTTTVSTTRPTTTQPTTTLAQTTTTTLAQTTTTTLAQTTTTVPVTSVPASTTIPPTVPVGTGPTTVPGSIPSGLPTTTSTRPTPSTRTTPTTTTTTVAGPSTSAPTTLVATTTTALPASSPTAPATSTGIVLDRPSSAPGEERIVRGAGCPPGRDVEVRIGDVANAETTADDLGQFETTLAVPQLAPGRYAVEARCGPVLVTDLDVVLVSRVSTGGSQFALLLFFLLSSIGLRRRRHLDRPAS